MKLFLTTLYSLTLLMLTPVCMRAQATVRMGGEPVDAARWIETRFAKGQVPPFSFVYGGKSSASLLPRWAYSATKLDSAEPDQIGYLYTYTDRSTGLKVECEVKGFPSFHAVEWVLRFTQTGAKDSPILENVSVVDLKTLYPESGDFTVHYAEGNHIAKNDFAPHSVALKAGETFTMAPEGGRSSQGDFLPFFNIQAPDDQGVVVGIGWSGTWIAHIDKTSDRGFSLQSGMKTMRLYLHPDESIRTPSVCLLYWNGADRMTGNNQFRRFVLAHHSRKIDGKTAMYPLSGGFNYRDPAPCTEYSCITSDWAVAMINRYKRFDLVPEVFWLDAGWHTGAGDYREGKTWANTNGNWTVDKKRFPEGLKPVADAAHKAGAKFMVWFEPERVVKGTQWAVEHPEWMLDLDDPENTWLLFDLGNRKAREWMQQYLGDMIEENEIDYYRQDFNMEPDKYWARYDEPDRVGMKEIRHIEGLYAFWDYLLGRFPNLLIDNCASGGRRLDLETIGRSAPLWRSDYYHYDDPDGYQCHTYGLNFFLPFHGTGILQTDEYSFRSSISSALIYNWKITEPGVSFLDMQERLKEYQSVRGYFLEDYYPLTGTGDITRDDIWLAYQLNRPSDGTGLVVAFRRAACPDPSLTVSLSGLDASRNYSLRNFDTGESVTVSGADLAKGYVLTLDGPRKSMLLEYKIAD